MASRRQPVSPARFVPPMKALGVEAIPDHGEWHSEIKFDGYRAVAVINGATVALWSRNKMPLDYPELLPTLKKLRCTSAVLDGEIVALDASGHSNFQALQGRGRGERPPIQYYVFDLLFLNGHSCLALPFEERRKLLEKLLAKATRPLAISPSFAQSPRQVFAAAKRQGLEGIILKQAGSVYEPDRRSGVWLKVKNLNEQEFVIGGFTPPRRSRQGFGAILIGHYQRGKLIYAGKVGTGFDVTGLHALHRKFLALRVADCPFANLPLDHRSRFGTGMTRAVMRTVTWLKPKLVAQIKFTEWTIEGLLRHPVFLGLRTDKAATAVRREAPAARARP